MEPWIHLSAFIAIAVVTPLWILGRATLPDGPRIVAALSLGPALAIGSGLLAFHECGMGQPIQQWLIPGLAISAVLLWTQHSVQKALAIVCLTGGAAALCLHYAETVHSPEWQGVETAASTEEGNVLGAAQWHTPLTGLYRKPGPPESDK